MVDTGISAAVLVPPPQVSHDSERYREYLYTLADDAPCPLLLYEWPQAPHYLMAPELFGELAHKRLIAGLKDTTCTYDGIRAKQAVAAEAVVYQANTPLLLDALAMGVRGIMAVTSTARRFGHPAVAPVPRGAGDSDGCASRARLPRCAPTHGVSRDGKIPRLAPRCENAAGDAMAGRVGARDDASDRGVERWACGERAGWRCPR